MLSPNRSISKPRLLEQGNKEVVKRLIYSVLAKFVMKAVLESHVLAAGEDERVVVCDMCVTCV